MGTTSLEPLTISELRDRATVSVEDVGPLLGVSRTGVYAAARRGDFLVIRIGHRMIVPVPPILRLLVACGDRRTAALGGGFRCLGFGCF